jgi:hypothetical protein
VRDVSVALLKQHLSLEVDGYKLTTEMALNVLLHDEPFYGKSVGLRAYTVRGEAQHGTTYFGYLPYSLEIYGRGDTHIPSQALQLAAR